MVYNSKKNKKRGGQPSLPFKKRKLTFGTDDNTGYTKENVKLEFLDINSLTEAYVNAINEWKEAEKENNREKLMRLTRGTLFTLLILLGILAYSEPSFIKGLSGEALKAAINKEMIRVVSEGIEYDNLTYHIKEFTANVSQIRFTFQNGDPLTASQIIDIFKQNETLYPIIDTVERALNIITGSMSEIKEYGSAAFKLAENLSTGQLSRKNIGDIAGFGIWSVILYIGLTFTKTAYSTVTGIGSLMKSMSTRITSNQIPGFIPTNISEQSLSQPLLLTIEGKQQVVTIGDILYTINNRPDGKTNFINSFFDSILTFIFSHEEQWTLDDTTMDIESENKSLTSVAASYVSNDLTSSTQSTLSKISDDGYGNEFGRMAKFINTNFGTQINDAIVVLGENVSLIYGSLFKVVCGRTGLDSNESSQDSDVSSISEITNFTDNQILCNPNTISKSINDSLANTLLNNLGELSQEQEIQNAAQSLLNLGTDTINIYGDESAIERGGKRKNRKNKTKKIKKHITKKKIKHFKKKYSHKKR